MFDQKQRVRVSQLDSSGNFVKYMSGTVNYKRMAPPDYFAVECYSVFLDDNIGRQNYLGTIFSADRVFSE